MCCISCFEYCDRCGGAFYVEDFASVDYDADGDATRLCHCCLEETR